MIFFNYVHDSSSDEENTGNLRKERQLLRIMFDPLDVTSQAWV